MKPISQEELKRRMLQCGGVSPDNAENEAIMALLERVERVEEALREISRLPHCDAYMSKELARAALAQGGDA